MERAWTATRIFEHHMELQVLKWKMEDLNFTLELADQDIIDTQAYMDGNGIPLTDMMEEILDEELALSRS